MNGVVCLAREVAEVFQPPMTCYHQWHRSHQLDSPLSQNDMSHDLLPNCYKTEMTNASARCLVPSKSLHSTNFHRDQYARTAPAPPTFWRPKKDYSIAEEEFAPELSLILIQTAHGLENGDTYSGSLW